TVVCIDRAAGAEGHAAAGAPPVLDYWYPHTRSPLCLHATLAAAAVLFAEGRTSFPRTRQPHLAGTPPTLAVTTAMRAQPLVLSRAGDDYYVRLAVQPAPTLARLPGLAALLGQPVIPASAPQVASVGSPKLLVEVADAATLHGLRPDLAAISAWGKAAGVNGIYAWCRHPDGRYEGRNFNHLDPALEDSATGVAAGALTVLLGHGLTLQQGRATGRDCLIRTRIEHGAILIGGRVTPLP
ncbi:PhzF family phenazine biosynthesis protein, partial [Massilia terrae]